MERVGVWIYTSVFLLGAIPGLMFSEFKLGLENVTDTFLRSLSQDNSLQYKVGLITNQTGKDRSGRRNVDILLQRGVNIRYLFAPEHGFEGIVAAEKNIDNMIDKKTNIPVISLYKHGSGAMIDPEILKQVDVLIFDIQDSGMRHYTYISTLLHAMQAAAQYNKHIVVLDRPNPLGGVMEGPLVENDLYSFISIASIPLRHGMTVGELALFFNTRVLKRRALLHVVKMKGYARHASVLHDAFTYLSPNLKSMTSCHGYSFLGLLSEIRPFDVGVNSRHAFQCIMLPKRLGVSKKTWFALDALLQKHGIKSYWHERYNPGRKEWSQGLRVIVKDIHRLAAFKVLLDVVEFFKKRGIHIFSSPMLDKAAGTTTVQKFIKGHVDGSFVLAQTKQQLKEFLDQTRSLFLYEPLPIIP